MRFVRFRVSHHAPHDLLLIGLARTFCYVIIMWLSFTVVVDHAIAASLGRCLYGMKLLHIWSCLIGYTSSVAVKSHTCMDMYGAWRMVAACVVCSAQLVVLLLGPLSNMIFCLLLTESLCSSFIEIRSIQNYVSFLCHQTCYILLWMGFSFGAEISACSYQKCYGCLSLIYDYPFNRYVHGLAMPHTIIRAPSHIFR